MFMVAALGSLLNVILMSLWLLIRGVDEDKWRLQAAQSV
jgi:hypothetical protein